jgi:hypothetical protein
LDSISLAADVRSLRLASLESDFGAGGAQERVDDSDAPFRRAAAARPRTSGLIDLVL